MNRATLCYDEMSTEENPGLQRMYRNGERGAAQAKASHRSETTSAGNLDTEPQTTDT